MSEFTKEEENNKESDVELESNGEAGNKRLLPQFKVKEKPCSRRPKGRSDSDVSHCLSD